MKPSSEKRSANGDTNSKKPDEITEAMNAVGKYAEQYDRNGAIKHAVGALLGNRAYCLELTQNNRNGSMRTILDMLFLSNDENGELPLDVAVRRVDTEITLKAIGEVPVARKVVSEFRQKLGFEENGNGSINSDAKKTE